MPTNILFNPANKATIAGKNIKLVDVAIAEPSIKPSLSIYVSSGLWEISPDCKLIKVIVLGGGGGGGNYASTPSLASAGGGGGAGGYAIKYLSPYSYLFFSDIVSAQISIGGGGSLGASGGTSSIVFNTGLTISATGGSSGNQPSKNAADFGLGGLGGIGSNGDLNLPGKIGENGKVSLMYTYTSSSSSRTFLTSATLYESMGGGYYIDTNAASGLSGVSLNSDLNYENASGGNGASSEYGAGGRGAKSSYNSTSDESAATSATGYGSGGAGGSFTDAAGTQAGSSGSSGLIIIEEYY